MATGIRLVHSNRLLILAGEIKELHQSAITAEKTAIELASEGGVKLIEAKSICPANEWLSWLRQIGVPERTAQLYMQIAREKIKHPKRISDFVQKREPLRAVIRAIQEPKNTSAPRPDPAAQRGQPERDGPDFWPTPDSLIRALVDHVLPELPAGPIWECAVGDGRLAEAIFEAGNRHVVATDLYPQEGYQAHDFLTEPPPLPGLIAVTNPPFNRDDEFLDRGLTLLDENAIAGLVLLMRHDHLMAGGKVAALNRAIREIHCNWRPVWIAGTEDSSPRWAFHWIVWHNGPRRPPIYLSES